LPIGHNIIWLSNGDEIPDWKKHMIQSPKLMLMFVWNRHGFEVVDAMSYHAMRKGEMFTAAHDVRNILAEIIARPRVKREVKGGWSCMLTMQGKAKYSKKGQESFAITISCELYHMHPTRRI
jgi:hypothetical protein